MSSANNDLTQGLLAEARRKDELLDAYREKVVIMEKLIAVKDERINVLNNHIEELRKIIETSNQQFDRAIEIANKILK